MKKKLLVAFAFVGLAVASAKTYTMTLFQPAMVGNTELKAGDYKVDVTDEKAIIRSGKLQAESKVKIENVDSKYDTTTVRFSSNAGKMQIQEIRLGGTKTKLVFLSE